MMKVSATKRYALVALSVMGSAILLFSCGTSGSGSEAVNNETLMTERSENLSILMSENGRRSYHFKTPLLEGYTLAADPYREFRKGIHITTYKNDSLSAINATLTANYAIYYEDRELWEAKGDVVVEKTDGTKLYTQQLYWNSKTGRIYSNVDSKIVKGSDVFMGEGFESDEELKEWRFRRMSGKMLVNMEPTENSDSTATAKGAEPALESEAKPKSGAVAESKSDKVKAQEKDAKAKEAEAKAKSKDARARLEATKRESQSKTGADGFEKRQRSEEKPASKLASPQQIKKVEGKEQLKIQRAQKSALAVEE